MAVGTTDTTPKFDLHNLNGEGKSFSPIEGTLAIASIKSTLDKDQLFDALAGVESIPPMSSLEGRVPFTFEVQNYEEWPFKIIYASNGLSVKTILNHLNNYYEK